MERATVFQAIVGSHNYNLSTPESDTDYKMFVMPTFDDLYLGKSFNTSKVTPTVDTDVHDVRRLSDLFWKANLNFIEVLYTINTKYPFEYYNFVTFLKDHRQELVTMNLPYLFNACHGMYCQKMAKLLKGTEGTQHLVDKYGYDTKQALHAYRVLDFIRRFRDCDWNFKEAIRYKDTGVRERDFMLSIKHGEWEYDDFREMISSTCDIAMNYEKYYKEVSPKEEVKAMLDYEIKYLVKGNFMGGM